MADDDLRFGDVDSGQQSQQGDDDPLSRLMRIVMQIIILVVLVYALLGVLDVTFLAVA